MLLQWGRGFSTADLRWAIGNLKGLYGLQWGRGSQPRIFGDRDVLASVSMWLQ